MPTVETQLRELAHHLDTVFADVELAELTPPPGRIRIERPRRQIPGWVAATVAAVLVLVAVGGTAWILQGEPPEVADEPPTATTTQAVTASTAAPSTTVPTTSDGRIATAARWSVDVFTGADGLPGAGVAGVTIGADGTVWAAGLEDQRVSLFRGDGQTWTQVGEALPVPGVTEFHSIDWMVPSAAGGIVLEVAAGGGCDIAHFDGEAWTRLSEREGTPSLERCTAQAGSDGTPWVFGYDANRAPVLIEVAEAGLVVHRTGSVPAAFPVAELRATFDIAPDGTVWFGTSEGAWSYDRTDLTFHPLEAAGECCPAKVAVDSAGQVWVQLGSDMFRYTGDDWTRYTTIDGLPDFDGAVATIIPTSDGSVWVVTSSVVARFNNGAWTTYAQTEARAENMPVGDLWVSTDSPDGTTWTVSQMSGDVWLHRFIDDHWEGGNLTTMQWAEPSPGNLQWTGFDLFNRPLVVAPDAAVWITTSQGIARITPLD